VCAPLVTGKRKKTKVIASVNATAAPVSSGRQGMQNEAPMNYVTVLPSIQGM
jgi:hypothetical protein